MQIPVYGKGHKERVLPLRGRVVLTCEEYLLTPLRRLDRPPEPDDFLLYSEWRKYGPVYRVDPKKPMPRQTVRRGDTSTCRGPASSRRTSSAA